VQQLCKGLLADARFSFDGGYLQVWGDNFGPADKLARGGADGDERSGTWANGEEIEGRGQRLRRLYQILHRHVRSSTLRPGVASAGSQWIYRLREGRT
jgi:hypothetical protein